MPFGRLVLTGPAVLPLAAQEFRCVRLRQCEIERFEGAAVGPEKHGMQVQCHRPAKSHWPQASAARRLLWVCRGSAPAASGIDVD